ARPARAGHHRRGQRRRGPDHPAGRALREGLPAAGLPPRGRPLPGRGGRARRARPGPHRGHEGAARRRPRRPAGPGAARDGRGLHRARPCGRTRAGPLMELREAFDSSVESLRAHRLRALLTMLGMIFGVGAVIAMLSIGAGAERQALALIDALGVRNVMVQVKEPTRDPELQELRKQSVGLTERDARAISEAVPGGMRGAQKAIVDTYKVLGEDGRAKPRVLGVSPSYGAMMKLPLLEGRFLDDEDLLSFSQVCVLGSAIRRDLFGFGEALGHKVKINERWLTVVGVLA